MKDLSTHLLLLVVAAVWGSTWAVGRFLSYGLDEGNRASMEPATSAWLRYTLSQLSHLLFGAGFTEILTLEEFSLKEKKHGNIRFGWPHWAQWVTNFFS